MRYSCGTVHPFIGGLLILLSVFLSFAMATGTPEVDDQAPAPAPVPFAGDAPKADLPQKISGALYQAVLVPAGTFTVGCTTEQGADCKDREKPTHKVTISRPYYLMTSEVTQAFFNSLTGRDFNASDRLHPANWVPWYEAVRFANVLSEKEGLETCYLIDISGTTISRPTVSLKGLDCAGWRLPTNAEWEWAARGAQEAKYKYSGGDTIDAVGWYSGNSDSRTHPVCKLKTNALGLCDMSGNVWEWVWDVYTEYTGTAATVPKGDDGSMRFPPRVLRGGSWFNDASDARVSYRKGDHPGRWRDYYGFRLLRVAK